MNYLANSMSHIIMEDASFWAMFHSVLRYAVTLYLQYNVSILQASVTDIVDVMLWSDHLPPTSTQTYLNYVRVGLLYWKKE